MIRWRREPVIMFNCSKFHPQGLKARKIIAQGKASPRATPWVNRRKDFQALKGRKKADSASAIRFFTACSWRLRILRLSRFCRKLTRLPATLNPCARRERRMAERSCFTCAARVGTRHYYQGLVREAMVQSSFAHSGLGLILIR